MLSKRKEKKQPEDINIMAANIVKKTTEQETSKTYIKKQTTKESKKK